MAGVVRGAGATRELRTVAAANDVLPAPTPSRALPAVFTMSYLLGYYTISMQNDEDWPKRSTADEGNVPLPRPGPAPNKQKRIPTMRKEQADEA